jgi:hypothetical protein
MPSTRSALGFLAILAFLAAYIGLAIDLVFYLVAGIAWVPPAGRLLRWGAGGPL